MPLEFFGWFFVGAGSTMVVIGLASLISTVVRIVKRRRKFKDYVKSLQSFSENLRQLNEKRAENKREISELTFRDRDGVLCTVKIVVDYNLTVDDDDKERIKEIMMRGGAEKWQLSEIMSGASIEEEAMKKVQQFVFSGHAADQMRAHGIELDDVVRKMLKASGRIA